MPDELLLLLEKVGNEPEVNKPPAYVPNPIPSSLHHLTHPPIDPKNPTAYLTQQPLLQQQEEEHQEEPEHKVQ
jgi:hypothetical protein